MPALTPSQIAILEANGCRCADWSRVTVAEGFNPQACRWADFEGEVRLGAVKELSYCLLRNVSVGDGVTIRHCRELSATTDATYGNGVKVSVLDETGGRAVTIYRDIRAAQAYKQAFWRHSITLQNELAATANTLIAKNIEEARRLTVGNGSTLAGCGELRNVCIGRECTLTGVSSLSNGTVDDYTEVTHNVIASDFIFDKGARITDGAQILRSFIGQGAQVGGGFTAHDSIILANSNLQCGEACAIFAGPFTTSMHKSTLLIGGLFSFFNAGSGTNQSNHMYRLGPLHQGTMQRGCRTGSDAYLLWPAAIGAFTTVLGRHYNHPDTRRLPFSTLIGNPDGTSTLLPGQQAGTIGLARDVDKWPRRDHRPDSADTIDFQWLSPYTLQYIIKGVEMLQKGETPAGVTIPERARLRGIERYRLLTDIFAAQTLEARIRTLIAVNPHFTPADILTALAADPGNEGAGQWADIAGHLTPVDTSSAPYHLLCWQWAWHHLLRDADPAGVLSRGADALKALLELQMQDAAKEFGPVGSTLSGASLSHASLSHASLSYASLSGASLPDASLSFGIDHPEAMAEDLRRVRGSLDTNRFLALHRRNTLAAIAGLRSLATIFQTN